MVKVIALSPHALSVAEGVLARQDAGLNLSLSGRLPSGFAQLPTLLLSYPDSWLVILGGDGKLASKDGGHFQLAVPFMAQRKPATPFTPAMRIIEPTFAACLAPVSVEHPELLEITNPPPGEISAAILPSPVRIHSICSASLDTDAHLQEMVVYQAENYGIRERGLVISYLPPIFGRGTAPPAGIEMTQSLWISGSGEPHELFDGMDEVKF